MTVEHVVVSGQPLDRSRFNGLGPRKIFVSKPYELWALVGTLRRLLDANG